MELLLRRFLHLPLRQRAAHAHFLAVGLVLGAQIQAGEAQARGREHRESSYAINYARLITRNEAWSKGTVEDWAEQAHRAAQKMVYGRLPKVAAGGKICQSPSAP